jgi:6-phosphogluconolactonase
MPASSKTQVFDTLDQQIHAAARFILAAAEDAVGRRGRFDFVLSGGSTPAPLYERLASPPYMKAMPWSVTHFYWGDERIVPPNHAGSNYGQARRLLLDRIQAHPENVHRIKGELSAPEAATDYSELLSVLSRLKKGGPLFDLVLLGLGSDGHTASLFPGSLEQEPGVLAVSISADYGGRPAHRVTLTPESINRARQVVFLVSGADKAVAVKQSISGESDPHRWPAQKINPDSGQIVWMLDVDAAAMIISP